MIPKRTKILLLWTALAPASVLLAKLAYQNAVRDAEAKGAFLLSYHGGISYPILLAVGLASLFASIVSIVFDYRRFRKE